MPDLPFHVAGGSFTTRPAFNPLAKAQHPERVAPEIHPVGRGSLRRKLWDIPHKFHCPVIGVCFEVDQLRALMGKVMHFPTETTDFVLHTTAVGACETRTKLAELLHKQLEKRYQLSVRQFASAKSSAALRLAWHAAAHSGREIAAALWACWTHPACDAELEQEIYGEIHMLQHQLGTGTRTDLQTLNKLKHENNELRHQLDQARAENETLRSERSRETRALGERIAELRAEQAGRDASIAHLTQQLDRFKTATPDLKDRQILARRATDAEARALALTSHAASQQNELMRLRLLIEHAEETINQLVSSDETLALTDGPIKDQALSGKCILCVGGRSGAVDAYRQMVEQRGGRFLHHDGGLEERIQRIDGALAAADLVICQAGCISHNAYWRVKEQCKRTGKACVFVKGAGVSSFGRIVNAACAERQETPLTRAAAVDIDSH